GRRTPRSCSASVRSLAASTRGSRHSASARRTSASWAGSGSGTNRLRRMETPLFALANQNLGRTPRNSAKVGSLDAAVAEVVQRDVDALLTEGSEAFIEDGAATAQLQR